MGMGIREAGRRGPPRLSACMCLPARTVLLPSLPLLPPLPPLLLPPVIDYSGCLPACARLARAVLTLLLPMMCRCLP